MPGIAITDHGNMFGVKEFFKYAAKYPEVKPIIGCEIYVSKYDHTIKDKDHREYYHLILLAKNYNGYRNLMKIVSTGHIEGMYYGKPRVSHSVVEKYAGDLVCCSACIAGEIPKNIIAGDMEAAEKAIEWHKKVFGDDYYLEVQLHRTEVPGLSLDVYERQRISNEGIYRLAEKTGVKVVATNDVHFVNREDGPVHDRLICLTTNANIDDPKRLRYTQQEYLKSEEEMAALFPDHPEALSNTMEIFDKIENYKIDRGHVLPVFRIEDSFLAEKEKYLEKYKEVIDAGRCDKEGNDRGEAFTYSVAYLCELCYKGAERRYGTLTQEQAERIDFELKTICRMGFPDYFLIVQDFIAAARRQGISVGPGRGSAAGSAVAYCLGITNMDPIKYQLLFERFLNPDRISMPDIDIDFDDDGRYKVFKYVEDTYGKDHVSHVVTFGTMAAKMAIKDVARISNMSIDEANRLTKMVPDKPFEADVEEEVKQPDGSTKKVRVKKEFKPKLSNCVKYSPDLKNEYENGSGLTKEVLRYAVALEGSIRQTGVHACAMIIGRGDLTDYIPITIAADKATGLDVWVSQYEGSFIEEVGMLKMDFLGLKTLSIIKECLETIRKTHGTDIDIESIPIDDEETYRLYGRGDTTSVFQFESPGMKEWLQKLQPTRFEDLIAMNALYRPGPMDYIPSFVARKQGTEKIEYDLPEMEEFLQDTYGVTVYQEQVMLLSQKLAGFTKGQADKLRKAMGKKMIDVMNSLKDLYLEGGIKNGHPKEILEKIWADWEKFAQYAFNKSHATCYAWVSYQTGYLKAHYPAEFQAANLSKNLSNMDEIKKIMDDCKKSRIKVLNPDINESDARFTVNKDGNIRFGLGGIKGFGDNIVKALLEEREKNGPFADIWDFVERMGGLINKKSFEALLYSGAFDSFGYKRSQYHLTAKSGDLFVDELLKYAALFSRDRMNSANSLFGEMEETRPKRPEMPEPTVSDQQEDSTMEMLKKEKELVGMYLSAHPLDKYRFEIKQFTDCTLTDIQDLISQCDREKKSVKIKLAGYITNVQILTSKSGAPWSKTVIEDFSGSYEFALFGRDHEAFMQYLQMYTPVFIEGSIEEKYFVRPEERKIKGNPPYVLKIKKISLLGNIGSSLIKGFVINLNTNMLNDEFRQRLVAVVKKNAGTVPLSMFLYDPQTRYKIEFLSKKFRIAVNDPFISDLEDLNINYSVITK